MGFETGNPNAAAETSGERADGCGTEPLRAPFLVVDDFYERPEAEAMRGHFEAHFANPHSHRPDTHQLWNYWYVPQLYTYLRSSPERLMPLAMVQRFHAALSRWAVERLGMADVTWPNLSLYVDGCRQHLHNDSGNGRFGYVFSLTPDSRRSRGGETLLLREGDLFRGNLSRPAAGSGMYELVAPDFNRLTIFDDRLPHGVERVEGTMDPIDGRLVLHGHISEGPPIVDGPLDPADVADRLERVREASIDEAGGGAGLCHGPLSVRLRVGEDGGVERLSVLVDRVVRPDGCSAGAVVEAVLDGLRRAEFARKPASSVVTAAIIFGPTLPAKHKISIPVSRIASAAPEVPVAERPKPRPAAASSEVTRRLRVTAGVAAIPKERIEAYVVPHFLGDEECAALAQLADRSELDRADAEVQALVAKIDSLLGLAPEFGEPPEALRLAAGEQVKPRFDFFDPDALPAEGQRTWTVAAFLSCAEEGGQWLFANAQLRITPARGHLLVWNNLLADGSPNGFTVHETLPVGAGVERAILRRYRDRTT